MSAPAAVVDLVERFERNIDQYKKAQNETQVRREFIDPFFDRDEIALTLAITMFDKTSGTPMSWAR